jgi:hypothetical protein
VLGAMLAIAARLGLLFVPDRPDAADVTLPRPAGLLEDAS